MLFAAQILVSLTVAGWLSWSARRLPPRALVYRGTPVVLLALALWTVPDGYVLQKCVGRLAMPAGLLWLALIATMAAAWYRRAPRAAAVVAILWLGYTLAGSPWVGGALVHALESPYDADPFEAGPFDAVFVLGGGTTSDGDGRIYLTGSGDRVILGARMYHAGRTQRLVASGETVPGRAAHHDAARATRRLWRGLGVPDDAIVTVPDVHNTSEELAAYAELVGQRGWARIGLISSARHLRRAMQRARDHGLQVQPLAADRRGSARFEGWMSVIPSGGGFALVHQACWELLGAAVGR